MYDRDEILRHVRIDEGDRVRLKDHDPAWAGDQDVSAEERKALAEKVLRESVERLARAQEGLYAADRWSVLVILQAMDAAGKDGVIKHVFSGVNPQGCQVVSFKQPSDEELDHDFLWRCSKALPERGRIGIFNRSYYEEVLVVRVHPEWLERQRLPKSKAKDKFWRKRFESINAFEEHLHRSGTLVLKFFLHLSKDEQRTRFIERIENPAKNWKFSLNDVRERARWDDYHEAYAEAIEATSTKQAPWFIIPADKKWVARAMVADIVAAEIDRLGVGPPAAGPDLAAELEEAKRLLAAE
jgi:PPK2 family polyphosphate:nucleotide phosphotransferase